MKPSLVDCYREFRADPQDLNRDRLLAAINGYALALYRRDFDMQPSTREDLAQDCTIKAWRYLDRFADRSSITTWIHRIAVTVRADHFKRPTEEQIPELYDQASDDRPLMDCLPSFLLDDPIARDLMDDVPVAEIQKKHAMPKWAYYRHLQALGKRMQDHNQARPHDTAV